MYPKRLQNIYPEQIPVMVFDAPLYAFSKLIQWKWLDYQIEDKFTVVLGGMHIDIKAKEFHDEKCIQLLKGRTSLSLFQFP